MSDTFFHPITGDTMGGLGRMKSYPGGYQKMKDEAYKKALARYEANNKDKIQANIANYVQKTPEEYRKELDNDRFGTQSYKDFKYKNFVENLENDTRGKAVQSYYDRMENPSAEYTAALNATPSNTQQPRFAGTQTGLLNGPRLVPIEETLDRGMNDRSDEIGRVGETIPATTGLPKGSGIPASLGDQKPPAPLTGTTSEGVMANFQPDPQRDSAQTFLDQTVANVEPDKGSTATPTQDQQMDASVQQLDTKAGSAPSSGEMASPKMAGETSLEGLQPASQETPAPTTQDMSYGDVSPEQFNNFENQQDPYPKPRGTEFMQQYADIPAGQPQPNYQATFPEYMNEYSPQQMGNFANFESNMPSYSQDNEYQNYEPYNTPGQYQADQMQDVGQYDMGNFMDFNQVPQSQNNFSEAGNFFATANSQMENAAVQETKADKKIRIAGQMGGAGKRL